MEYSVNTAMAATTNKTIVALNTECDANFTGSASAMEPHGTLTMFFPSLDHKIRYKHLIADGDCKTHALYMSKRTVWARSRSV